MLLLTAPLLFLLGTSVVALKPEYVGPNLIPVGQNPTRRPPAQVRLDNRLIHTIVGFWDRIPTKDAHIEHRNDVIEVVLREDGDIGYGVVYFHQMGEKPGEITNRIEAVLTVENLERFRGNWRRAIKASNTRDDRLQRLEVIIEDDRAPNLVVSRERLLSASPSQDETSHTATDASMLGEDAGDFWYRIPTVNMNKDYMTDVMFLRGNYHKTFYQLSDEPGKMQEIIESIEDPDERALGKWRRMSRATVKTIVRLDELTIARKKKSEHAFYFEFINQKVYMLGWDPDHPL